MSLWTFCVPWSWQQQVQALSSVWHFLRFLHRLCRTFDSPSEMLITAMWVSFTLPEPRCRHRHGWRLRPQSASWSQPVGHMFVCLRRILVSHRSAAGLVSLGSVSVISLQLKPADSSLLCSFHLFYQAPPPLPPRCQDSSLCNMHISWLISLISGKQYQCNKIKTHLGCRNFYSSEGSRRTIRQKSKTETFWSDWLRLK